jgi:CDP-6-deoxy-D-xylo-4-hexulose-3-dehydrase
MSTIEGGAICTDDERLARMLRLVRAHGWDRNLDEEAQLSLQAEHNINSEFYSRYTFYDLGYNLRPTEIAGFLGNQQIRYLPEILKRRQQNFLTLATLYENPAYYPLEYKHIDFISNFAFPIVCKSKQLRDELVARCRNIVEIRPIVGGDMTKQPFFRKYVTQPGLENRNANLIHEQGLYFGNNPELTAPEVRTLREIFA